MTAYKNLLVELLHFQSKGKSFKNTCTVVKNSTDHKQELVTSNVINQQKERKYWQGRRVWSKMKRSVIFGIFGYLIIGRFNMAEDGH